MEVLASCDLGEAWTLGQDKCPSSTNVLSSWLIRGKSSGEAVKGPPISSQDDKQVRARVQGKSHDPVTPTPPRLFVLHGRNGSHRKSCLRTGPCWSQGRECVRGLCAKPNATHEESGNKCAQPSPMTLGALLVPLPGLGQSSGKWSPETAIWQKSSEKSITCFLQTTREEVLKLQFANCTPLLLSWPAGQTEDKRGCGQFF